MDTALEARRARSHVREGALRGGLTYLAFGEGPPLVVFPGLSPDHANPTGMARVAALRPVRPLAKRFTVHVVNRKPGLARGATIADIADDYAAALDRAFREPVPVVGISTGGSVAQRFAIDHPRLVRRLVLVATACRLSPYGREVQRTLARLILADQPRRAWANVGRAGAASTAGGWAMAALMWLLGRTMAPDDPSDMLATIEAEDAFDASPELDRIAAPTLLIAGERDRFYTPELFWETARRIPNSRLCWYRGRGHVGSVTLEPVLPEVFRFLTAEEPLGAPQMTA